ncbi:protein APCDD1 [Caerostris extrusa]|uniref:Protein APCDD1 n=1 Tax=Caerostris extrusa TaxID=172846 RepID=A0AAV4N592_CAEEX|nr:protein APCDD1 [Caerostris extrusa]
MEQDLVRFERSGADLMFLYLGETTEDKKRPTSFQPPLVRCATPESKMAEDYFHNYNQLRPLPLVSGTSAVHNSVLCFFVVCFLSKLLAH